MNQEEIIKQLQLAVVLHGQGKFDRAISIYRQVLNCDSENFNALNLCGCALRSTGSLNEALDFLRRAVSIDPVNVGVRSNLGNVLRDMNMSYEASMQYKAAFEIDPFNAPALYEYAKSRYFLGDVVTAIAGYRSAIRVKHDFIDAYLNLVTLLIVEGEIEEAIAICEQSFNLHPENKKLVELLGSILIALERFEEAKEVLGSCRPFMEHGSVLHFLFFLAERREDHYLQAVDLDDPNCIYRVKYLILRMLRRLICLGHWLEDVYDRLYGEMFEAFGIQGLDTTGELYVLKSLESWSLPSCSSLAWGVYSSRFSLESDSLKLTGPFSSDINHLSHAGHFYLLLSSNFGEKVDMVGRSIEIRLDYRIDTLSSKNLCLGFSARVGDEWKQDERSHSYVDLFEHTAGVFIADVSAKTLKELGSNNAHFTSTKYKLWDPLETAHHASGMFLFLRSSDYPVNPKGSLTIHFFNVI